MLPPDRQQRRDVRHPRARLLLHLQHLRGQIQALPVGVQLIAAPWREDRLFAAAAKLERLGVCGALDPMSIAP
mgnify:CR=1 FL=1